MYHHLDRWKHAEKELKTFFEHAAPRAVNLEHSSGSLVEHLLGTWRILHGWGASRTVCKAGLYHNCYSTQYYAGRIFDLTERRLVRSLIGRDAEFLAYHFCGLNRADLWEKGGGDRLNNVDVVALNGGFQRISAMNAISLLLIEAANLADQSCNVNLEPVAWLARISKRTVQLAQHARSFPFNGNLRISYRRELRAIELYGSVLWLEASDALPVLDQIIEMNPWVGEPRILRSLCAIELGKFGLAYSDARSGQDILSAWFTAWDKRLTFRHWTSLAESIAQSAAEQNRTLSANVTFEGVAKLLSRVD